MGKNLGRTLWAAMGIALLALAGCAPSASTQSGSSMAGPAGKGSSAQAATVRESASSRSSMEAHREGKSAGSGPLMEVYFDFDRYDLRPDAREALKANAEWLRSNRSSRVEVEGHADERGTSQYNLALGSKRAQSARDYLVSLGVSAGRLSTISYGEELPACNQHNEECWQKNRRARFVVRVARPAS